MIETDCPDMMPLPCSHLGQFNEPAHLHCVLDELSELFNYDKQLLAISFGKIAVMHCVWIGDMTDTIQMDYDRRFMGGKYTVWATKS